MAPITAPIPESSPNSEARLLELVLPGRAHPSGLLHGAEALRMMGEAACICAARHARGASVVLARADNIELRKAARLGEILDIRAQVAFQGATSLTVLVSIFIENAPEAQAAAIGRFMLVAVDSDGLPTPLPKPAAKESAS